MVASPARRRAAWDHYTRGDNVADDSVTPVDPDFLVYAPKNGPRHVGEARRRLAAFDYFIPYSTK